MAGLHAFVGGSWYAGEVPDITCPLCRRTLEAGPEHCPHCHIRLPGAPRRVPPPARRGSSAARPGRATPRVTRKASETPLQCPACNHSITREDTWCKWCHWPVNRDTR